MKYKLLSIASNDVINIGDYVQALASAQFLPRVDGFVDREFLDTYNGAPAKIVMNGWFMHHPEHWPPSPKVFPCFLAFHINSSVSKEMLSYDGVAYLKKYAPIGCRDLNTVRLLSENNVDAYFSGCMTLTLGKNYYDKNKEDKWYFVDPLMDLNFKVRTLVKSVLTFLRHPKSCFVIAKAMNPTRFQLRTLLKSASFFRTYSKKFSKDFLLKAQFINQENSRYKTEFSSDEERLREAERLVKMYSKAKCVVTSRIHCALPCLGLETPVIFLKNLDDKDVSSCRFGGLQELFNVMEFDGVELKSTFACKSEYVDYDFPKNKEDWKVLAKDIVKKCEQLLC